MPLFKICDGYAAMLYSEPFRHVCRVSAGFCRILPNLLLKNSAILPGNCQSGKIDAAEWQISANHTYFQTSIASLYVPIRNIYEVVALRSVTNLARTQAIDFPIPESGPIRSRLLLVQLGQSRLRSIHF